MTRKNKYTIPTSEMYPMHPPKPIWKKKGKEDLK